MALYMGGVKIAGTGPKIVYCNSLEDYQSMTEHDPSTIYITPHKISDRIDQTKIRIVDYGEYIAALENNEIQDDILYLTKNDPNVIENNNFVKQTISINNIDEIDDNQSVLIRNINGTYSSIQFEKLCQIIKTKINL